MNIIGLHFGHDGGVCVVRDGVTVVVLMTERVSRIKHAFWVDASMIDDALSEAGLTIRDIDFCAVTTTQRFPIVTQKNGRLKVRFVRHPKDKLPSAREAHCGGNWDKLRPGANLLPEQLRKGFEDAGHRGIKSRLEIHTLPIDQLDAEFAPENMVAPRRVMASNSLETIAQAQFEGDALQDNARYTAHAPLTVTFDGVDIPGAFVDHHTAHAAGAYYQSAMRGAVILSSDGSDDPRTCSGAYLGIDHKLFGMALPQLWAGAYYRLMAVSLGVRDAGKLMGLSSYGTPRLFDPQFVGTMQDLGFPEGATLTQAWIDRAIPRARDMGYDIQHAGNPAYVLEAINADLAASAQQTFEENTLGVIKALKSSADRLPFAIDGLCMSGGCALSCPTNTRAFLETGFERVFVEPACDDSGLCVGAALFAYHNLHDRPLIARDPEFPMTPYLGKTYSRTEIEKSIAGSAADLMVEDLQGLAATAAATDLAADAVIGWFEGRSEIGPRALGHRSILADPRIQENWARTNLIKGREGWRPFAPAVLEEDASRWFKDMPATSPYMLFTGNVMAPDALPAITHVDGTARVQTVTDKAGDFENVLKGFRRATNSRCSVVMNTSLNGPGEPIVETAAEAVAFFRHSGLDAIYIDGFRVAKK